MKKILLFFLLIITFPALVKALIEVEHSVTATVTINEVEGKLKVFPSFLEINAPPLSLVKKNLTFWQENGNIDLNVSLYLEESEINDWLSFSAVDFTVKPNETKDIITYINIPNITIGTYSGNIHAITNSQDLIIPVNITITDKYKIDINIDALERKIKAGDYISVFTELTKTKTRNKDPEVEGKITVDLVYNVLKGKDLITTLSTTMDVVDYSEKNISIPIPIDATRGGYIVEVIATHLDKTAKDRDNFFVTTNLLTRFFNLFRWFG
ncbi:MAG: hypothetical protein KKE93_02085 [Nanoarchaeota archaeon]|nr:hypothetical protein [Nanoarchaeota archaeon]